MNLDQQIDSRLDEETYKALKKFMSDKKRTRADAIRFIIITYLQQEGYSCGNQSK